MTTSKNGPLETKKWTMAQGLWTAPLSTKKRAVSAEEKDMSELIILAIPSSYSHRGVVWCVATKEVEKMRKTLEDFYYGNIVPGAQQMAPTQN